MQQPLASRLRPKSIKDFVGQTHILAEGKPLYEGVTKGRLHSMILWGPPGVGKTTLALLLSERAQSAFETLSAVTSGVKDIREVIERAKQRKDSKRQATILFVDEVHRFNKSQQDAFLPFVENGLLTFIGATTENPSFELNRALLSRVSVYTLKPLSNEELATLAQRAECLLDCRIEEKSVLIDASGGDGRKLLNFIAQAHALAMVRDSTIDSSIVKDVIKNTALSFDKGGDHFYEQISALHKSIRGSNADAALFWCMAMLKAGTSPHYILRRLVRVASEDIGNADPRALSVTLDAWQAFDKLGDEEGRLMIAQAVLYLAVAPKSNRVYLAFKRAEQMVGMQSAISVPIHLRNAPTGLMKSMGFGKNYQYAHDYEHAYVPGEQYFPDGISARFYEPSDRGLEKKIKEKMTYLASLDEKA